jgi:hypothetical protein
MDFSPLKRVTTKKKFRNNERYYNNMNQAGVNPDAGRGSLPKELKKRKFRYVCLREMMPAASNVYRKNRSH